MLLTLLILLLAWPPGPLHTWIEHLRSCLPGHAHTGELGTLAVAALSAGVVAWGLGRGRPA
nr:hypothetical protein GCM10020093_009790 [Planobispora longispora]